MSRDQTKTNKAMKNYRVPGDDDEPKPKDGDINPPGGTPK